MKVSLRWGLYYECPAIWVAATSKRNVVWTILSELRRDTAALRFGDDCADREALLAPCEHGLCVLDRSELRATAAADTCRDPVTDFL